MILILIFLFLRSKTLSSIKSLIWLFFFCPQVRDFRDRAHMKEIREKVRARATTYQELSEHERYPGLDRDSARPPLEIVPTPGRYRHSYAEPPRLGLAALHPY